MSERAVLRAMFDRAVAAAQPKAVMLPFMPDPPKGRVVVVGAGKASAAMAAAFEDNWNGPLSGLVVTRYGHGAATRHIEIVEAAHPVPDKAGEQAARRILDLADGLGADDLLVVLISGGGSALLALPAAGLGLADKQEANRLLLASGVPINDMNVVRKHLSAIKGGRLAAAAWPARCLALMISDVPGDDPGTIASGPTIVDASTLADARRILAPFHDHLPMAVLAALKNPGNETPKPGDPRLSNSLAHIIASPARSLAADAEYAEAAGIKPIILGDAIEGEARDIGCRMARRALAELRDTRPRVLLSGGETTVTLTKPAKGSGGRNVEFLLALAKELNGAPGIHALACDTDGIDGSAEIAGAHVAPDTIRRAERLGYRLERALADHDGHGFFARLGDQVITGPTLTNVNDFRAILIAPKG